MVPPASRRRAVIGNQTLREPQLDFPAPKTENRNVLSKASLGTGMGSEQTPWNGAGLHAPLPLSCSALWLSRPLVSHAPALPSSPQWHGTYGVSPLLPCAHPPELGAAGPLTPQRVTNSLLWAWENSRSCSWCPVVCTTGQTEVLPGSWRRCQGKPFEWKTCPTSGQPWAWF